MLRRTDDAGRTWRPVPTPPTVLTNSPYPGAGVSRVRFADVNDGWLFGPELWSTHDGGAHWGRQAIPGAAAQAPVQALETAAGVVHAAFFDVASDGEGVVHIASSVTGSDAWRMAPVNVPTGAGPAPHVQMVIQGTAGWLVEVDRTVVGGARLAGGTWTSWTPPCSDAGGDADLAASSESDLVAVCHEGIYGGAGTSPSTRFYVSSDGGRSFSGTSQPLPVLGTSGVASPAAGRAVVVATSNPPSEQGELLATSNRGMSWSAEDVLPLTDGVTELGFTSALQGVGILTHSDSQTGSLLMTFDGGRHWARVVIH